MTFAGRAVVVVGGQGDSVSAPGSDYRYKVVGNDTDGAYAPSWRNASSRTGRPCTSTTVRKMRYVLSGRGVFVVGEDRGELGAGDFVLVPRDAPPTLARLGSEDLGMLVVISPAGLEQFFVEVQRREAASTSMTEDEVIELAARFETRIVGPPIDPS